MTSQGVALLDTDRAEFGVIDGVLPGDLSVSLDENQPGGTGAQSGIVSLAVDGTVNIPDNLNSAMGQVFTDANIDDFVAAVNSGATGLIGLQISTDGQALELGAMNVVSGQDVRVFSTASDTTVAVSLLMTVATDGMLTISGTVQLTDFALVAVAWSSANSGTVAFDGGVTAVLPDGTAPAISGSIPGTLTAEWGGSTVVSIARSDSSATASFTPSDWSAVQWFGDANIDDFVAAVNSGATGLIGLQISTDGQALELGAMNVVSGQDVRVFSTASEVTVTHTGALSVAAGAMLTISGTISSLEYTESFEVATGGSLTVLGTIVLDSSWLVSALRADGAVVLGGGLTMPLPDGTAVSLDGELPGQITAQRDGATVGTVSRDGTGTVVASPDGWYGVVVTIKAWGGGGGDGSGWSSNSWGDCGGAAGGFATADYLALSGETLTVRVGDGGQGADNSGGSSNGFGVGGSPNGARGGSYDHGDGGGGGGASYVSTSRASTGVVVGAGGGGGGGGYWSTGSDCGGGGGGGTHNGIVGSGGAGNGRGQGLAGTNGNGGGGAGVQSSTGGASDFGGAGGHGDGADANGGGGGGHSDYGSGGGGGAASFKNIVAGSSTTVDATNGSPVNTGDEHYSSSGSGSGTSQCTTSRNSGTRGRVVLIISGEASFFDSPGSDVSFVVQ
eukprot:COSAG02_NODE_3241_length_7111_cov_9.239019_3_plen_674_part_00